MNTTLPRSNTTSIKKRHLKLELELVDHTKLTTATVTNTKCHFSNWEESFGLTSWRCDGFFPTGQGTGKVTTVPRSNILMSNINLIVLHTLYQSSHSHLISL